MQNNRTWSKLGLKAALAAAAAGAGVGAEAAFAQTETEGETIIVTARRTAENVQDVPLTVNVLSGDDLDQRGVSNFSEISGLAPNVIWSDAGGGTSQNRITVRGIYSNATSQGFDPGVGIYVDDVYVGNQFGFNSALLDIDRIEVLKGPQGTLFGRNTSAGAITIHTRRPSMDEAYLDLGFRAGNYELFEGRFTGNLPIAETAALKLSGFYRDREGYQRNVVTGERDANNEHTYGGRAQFLVRPTNTLEFLITGEYVANDDAQDIYSCVDPAAGPFVGICAFNPDAASVTNDLVADNNTVNEREMWNLAFQSNWDMPGGYELTTISAYRELTVHVDQDQDYVALDLVRSGYDVPENHQFSEEVRLSTPAERRLRGVIGAYFFDEHRITIIPQVFTPTFFAIQGQPPPADNVVAQTISVLDTTNWALFGQAQFDITPRLTAELGVRYSADEKEFDYQQTVGPTGPVPPGFLAAALIVPYPDPSVLTPQPTDGSESFSSTTGTASIAYELSEDVLIYGRYSTGYKSGGFQAATWSPFYDPTIPFDEENSEQYELGVKSEWFDGRLRLNASAFQINYDDIQQQITVPTTFGFVKFVGNVGAAESEGYELEASFSPFEGFSVDANIGIQEARYTEGSLAGRRIQYSPDMTAALALSYERTLWGDLVGVANLSGSYRDDIALNTNAPASPTYLEAESLTTWNGRIGIENALGNWGFYLWGDNITDERRFTNFTPGNVFSYHVTTPRTYGVELRTSF